MKHFSARLRDYLKDNNISQYSFAKAISQKSKHNFFITLRKVQRWTKTNEPRLTSFEGAHALTVIETWEKSKGIHHTKPGGNSRFLSENEKNELLDKKNNGIELLTFFERREVIDTFCNNGRPFSTVLKPQQVQVIRLYFGLNNSKKSFNKSEIGRKLHISAVKVRGILLSSLRRLKYPHLPIGKSFQSESFQKGKKVLDKFFKSGRFLSDVLNNKEEMIIRLRFGLDGRKPITLQAIGKRYHVTRESVRKTNLRSLQKLI